MTTKCTGIMGRIFGHKWEGELVYRMRFEEWGATGGLTRKCRRCGAVTGEKK